MRLVDRQPREQVRRRQAKAQRRHTRHVKGRRSPANQRLHELRPAGRTPIFTREIRNPRRIAEKRREGRDTFLRRGLSRLNPFKRGRYGAGHRDGGGGGHRG